MQSPSRDPCPTHYHGDRERTRPNCPRSPFSVQVHDCRGWTPECWSDAPGREGTLSRKATGVAERTLPKRGSTAIPPPHGRRKPGAGRFRFHVRKRDRDHPQGLRARRPRRRGPSLRIERATFGAERTNAARPPLDRSAHRSTSAVADSSAQARHQALTTRRVHLRKETCMPASTSGGAAVAHGSRGCPRDRRATAPST